MKIRHPIPGGNRSAALLALLAFSVLMGPPASAHATLKESTPRQGAHLEVLPDEVRFEFSQAMLAPASVVVTSPDGGSVVAGEPVVDGSVVRQTLTSGPDGTYTMAYRAVSEDGHPLSGEISFIVGDAEPEPSGATSGSARTEDPADTVGTVSESRVERESSTRNRLVALVGAMLFAGAGALYLLSRRTRIP